jgi:hypothetical protein
MLSCTDDVISIACALTNLQSVITETYYVIHIHANIEYFSIRYNSVFLTSLLNVLFILVNTYLNS